MTTPQLAAPDGLTAHVASEIRAMMGRLNINRAELSRRLNVEDSWVGKRLNGRTEITLTDLARIAEALGVQVVALLPRVTTQYPLMPHIPAQRVASTPVPHIAARLSTPIPGLRRTQPTGR